MSTFRILCGCALIVCSTQTSAQSCLTHDIPNTSLQRGLMFDLRASGPSAVSIDGFALPLSAPAGSVVTFDAFVLGTSGSFSGHETNPGAWSYLGSAQAISRGPNERTPLGLTLNVALAPAEIRGFYLRTDGLSFIRHGMGAAIGAPLHDTGALELRTGVAISGSFAAASGARSPNIEVHYQAANTPPQYQRNRPTARLTLHGVESDGCSPAITEACTQGRLNLVYQTTLAQMPFELAITDRVVVSSSGGGVVSLSGTQTTNLDFTGFYWFLFGGSTFAFTPIQGSFRFDGQAPMVAGHLSMQAFHADPSTADGFALSQAAQVDTYARTPVLISGDDEFVTIPLGAPLCAGASSFPFFGSSSTEISVSTNGRVMFTAPDNANFPHPTFASSGPGFVGAWADFDASSTGSIIASAVGSTIRIDWSSVPPFGITGQPDQTWAIVLDTSDGSITLESIQTFNSIPGRPMFLGISSGQAGGALDVGPTNFAAGLGSAPQPQAMIYEYGDHGSLAPGRTELRFSPNGLGHYDWSAL